MQTTDQLLQFADWLRGLMAQRGYPTDGPRAGGISDLARDSHVSQPSLSRIFAPSPRTAPSLETLRALAPVLGVPLREMLVRSGRATDEELPVATSNNSQESGHIAPTAPTAPDRTIERIQSSSLPEAQKKRILDWYRRDVDSARERAIAEVEMIEAASR